MIKKVIGAVLLVAGIFIALVLLYSGSIFPHIIGPVVFVTIGAVLLFSKQAEKSNP